MPRIFYIALGAAAGVVAVRQAARAAAALTPTSMAGSLVQSVREFAADVSEAMAEREEEIRAALGLDDSGDPDATSDVGDVGDVGDLRPGAARLVGAGSADPAAASVQAAGAATTATTGGADDDDFDPERTMRLVPGSRRP